MTKIKKQRRKKKFRYDVNRKRLKRKRAKCPTIDCKQIRQAWDEEKSVEKNLSEMGIVYDVNKSLKIPGTKDLKLPKVKKSKKVHDGSAIETDEPSKSYVVAELESDARAPRVRNFRLPDNHVNWLTYLIEKHGEDYKVMARDEKNHYQDTWKQIRAKIKTFKGIPEQYGKYVKNPLLELKTEVQEPELLLEVKTEVQEPEL